MPNTQVFWKSPARVPVGYVYISGHSIRSNNWDYQVSHSKVPESAFKLRDVFLVWHCTGRDGTRRRMEPLGSRTDSLREALNIIKAHKFETRETVKP